MKQIFNEASADIRITGDWTVRKVRYQKGNPVVALECSTPAAHQAVVHMDIDKATYTNGAPTEFTEKKKTRERLAKAVRKLIKKKHKL